MVSTSSGFSDASGPASGPQDFYLHLHLPPELDLPLPATTQIYHQPPTSYLIPRWDLGPDSGAFTRIEFPAIGSRAGIQEDVDTFETILAQCTAFLERATAPGPSGSKTSSVPASSSKAKESAGDEPPAYDPASFATGEGYAHGSVSSASKGGRIVLVDEEDGSVVGELGDGFQVVEDTAIKPGSKGLCHSLNVLDYRVPLRLANPVSDSRDRSCRNRTAHRCVTGHHGSARIGIQ